MSNRIKELRSNSGLTLKQLSEAVGIGKSTLASYESRGVTPRVDKAKILADYFDVSLEYLQGNSDDKNNLTTWLKGMEKSENDPDNQEEHKGEAVLAQFIGEKRVQKAKENYIKSYDDVDGWLDYRNLLYSLSFLYNSEEGDLLSNFMLLSPWEKKTVLELTKNLSNGAPTNSSKDDSEPLPF